MTLFLYEKGVNGISNIGRGKASSFYELITRVFEEMGKERRSLKRSNKRLREGLSSTNDPYLK